MKASIPRNQADPRPGDSNGTPNGDFDGAEIRALRKARSLSLTQLAERCELSVGYISQIERNRSTPSVRVLSRLAQALGVTVGWFFRGGSDGPADENDIVVRRGNRRCMHFREGFVDYLLSPGLDGKLELVLSHFPPGATTGEAYNHRGEEAGYVLRGRLEIRVGERRFELEAGDSFTFSSTEPHGYRNLAAEETVVIYAITPPTY